MGTPERVLVDRRSLAYRADLALRTLKVTCARGAADVESAGRPLQAAAAAALAEELGSSLTVEDVEAIRDGRSDDADPAELALLAQALGLPGWVLASAPPPGRRLVIVCRGDGPHATLVNDDGRDALSTSATAELSAWVASLPVASPATVAPAVEHRSGEDSPRRLGLWSRLVRRRGR